MHQGDHQTTSSNMFLFPKKTVLPCFIMIKTKRPAKGFTVIFFELNSDELSMNDRLGQFTDISTKTCSWTASLAFHAILAIAFFDNSLGSPNSKKDVYQHQQELSFANVVWEEKPVSNNAMIKSKVRTWKTTPESLLERKTHFSSGDQLNKIEKVIDSIVAKSRLPDHSHALVNKAEQDIRHTVEVPSSVPKNTVTSIVKLPIGRPLIEEKKAQFAAPQLSNTIVKKPLRNENRPTTNSKNPNPKVKNVEIKDHQIAGLKNKTPLSKFRTSDILKSLEYISKGYNSPPSLTAQTNSRKKLKPLFSIPPNKSDASKQSNVCRNKQLVVKKQVASLETRATIDHILRQSSNYQISPMTVDKLLSHSNSGQNKYKRVKNSMTLEQLLEISNRQEVSFICVD